MSVPVELARVEASLRATAAVGSVVHAVWALARAQLPRIEEAVAQATEYLDWVDEVVERLAGPPVTVEGAAPLTVLIGPERAFCGRLARTVLEHAPADGALGLVGTRLAEVASREPALSGRVAFAIGAADSIDGLGAAAQRLARALLEHLEGTPVALTHPRGARGRMHRVDLLALAREGGAADHDLYSSPARVLRDAVHESLEGRLRIALAESLRAEVRARLMATERARRAVDERRDALERARRVGEQEQVTRELLELIAAGLSGPPGSG
ncbi:MAG: hypothetical protein SangKO_053580 [Sandaracinaceae bacterium]